MKSDIQKLKHELAESLRRGNGGSWESDIVAVRKTFDDWFTAENSGVWIGQPITEIATRFAMWVLYAFHESNPDQANEDFLKAEIRYSLVIQPDGLLRVDDLTKLNNRKSELPTDNDAASDVGRDSVWNDTIAEAFPLLSDLGRYEVSDPFEAIGLLRLMVNGDDLSNAGTDAFDNWTASLRKTILSRRSELPADEDPAPAEMPEFMKEKIADGKRIEPADLFDVCPTCGNQVHPAPLRGIDCPDAFHNPGVRYIPDTSPASEHARFCDACFRYFSGPAKFDAKFTFCGNYCQKKFGDNPKGSRPAIIASRASMPNQIEDLGNADSGAEVRNAFRGVVTSVAFPNCAECTNLVETENAFLVRRPNERVQYRLCGVGCVAKFLGITD